MSKKIRTEAVDYLFQAILSLENKEECYTFLKTSVRSMSCFHCHRDLKWQECSVNRRHI